MTESEARTKILEDYKEWFAKRSMDVGEINYFIEEFKIDPCNPNTFTKPIDKLKKQLDNTIIPEPLKVIWTNIAKEGEAPHYKTVKTYKEHSENKVEEIRSKWISLNQHITCLTGMLNITKFYSRNISEQKDEMVKNKAKRNTRSKVNKFIKSYLENSSKYKMVTNVRIAELADISEGTLSKYFTKSSEILDKLIDELDDRLDVLTNKRNEMSENRMGITDIEKTIDNVLFNYQMLKAIKEKLIRTTITT